MILIRAAGIIQLELIFQVEVGQCIIGNREFQLIPILPITFRLASY